MRAQLGHFGTGPMPVTSPDARDDVSPDVRARASASNSVLAIREKLFTLAALVDQLEIYTKDQMTTNRNVRVGTDVLTVALTAVDFGTAGLSVPITSLISPLTDLIEAESYDETALWAPFVSAQEARRQPTPRSQREAHSDVAELVDEGGDAALQIGDQFLSPNVDLPPQFGGMAASVGVAVALKRLVAEFRNRGDVHTLPPNLLDLVRTDYGEAVKVRRELKSDRRALKASLKQMSPEAREHVPDGIPTLLNAKLAIEHSGNLLKQVKQLLVHNSANPPSR